MERVQEPLSLSARVAPGSDATQPIAPASLAVSRPPPRTDGLKETFRLPGLDVAGDMRVGQEWNFAPGRNRSRTTVRARLRATYAASDQLAIGAQIATGDPDDPNSTDVTLGGFLDDLSAMLDQGIRYTNGGLTLFGGNFPQQFQRTDMLWDSDVSPQGLAASYGADIEKLRIDARALWFVIDEASLARDSDMLGGQLALSAAPAPDVRAGLTASYYHFRLGSVAGADAGDFRGNLVSANRHVSDFHLLEGIGTLSWSGVSPRWPLNLTADYIRNLGAAVSGDTGVNLELAAGRIAHPGDWRIAYNYSRVEADAVLAAFSHDNFDLSTNYQLHGLGRWRAIASATDLGILDGTKRLVDEVPQKLGMPNILVLNASIELPETLASLTPEAMAVQTSIVLQAIPRKDRVGSPACALES